MRLSFGIFLSLLFCTTAWGQKVSTPEEVIGRIIFSGLVEGHDQKVTGGMGDAAAVAVTKVVGQKKLTTNQIESILVVLNSAFGGVEGAPDREPRTALFVLQYL